MSVIKSNLINDAENLIFSEISYVQPEELSDLTQRINNFFVDSQNFKLFPWHNVIFCHQTMFANINEKEFKVSLEKLFTYVESVSPNSVSKVMKSSNKNLSFGKMPAFSMEKTYELIEDVYAKTGSIVDVFKVLKDLGPPEPTFKFRLNNLEQYVDEVNIKFRLIKSPKVVKRKINRF